MKQRPPDKDDPTSEEEALEFDGAHTDRLDDSYRLRVVAGSENPHATVRFNDRRQSPLQRATETDALSSDASATVKQIKSLDNAQPRGHNEVSQQPESGDDPDATGLFKIRR